MPMYKANPTQFYSIIVAVYVAFPAKRSVVRVTIEAMIIVAKAPSIT